MSNKTTELSKAVETLKEALRNDPEYREGWKANIANAFYDAYAKHFLPLPPPALINKIANDGADRFLENLTYVYPKDVSQYNKNP